MGFHEGSYQKIVSDTPSREDVFIIDLKTALIEGQVLLKWLYKLDKRVRHYIKKKKSLSHKKFYISKGKYLILRGTRKNLSQEALKGTRYLLKNVKKSVVLRLSPSGLSRSRNFIFNFLLTSINTGIDEIFQKDPSLKNWFKTSFKEFPWATAALAEIFAVGISAITYQSLVGAGLLLTGKAIAVGALASAAIYIAEGILAFMLADQLINKTDWKGFYKNLQEVKHNPELLFDGIAPTMQYIFGQDAVIYGVKEQPCLGNHHNVTPIPLPAFNNFTNSELTEFLKQNL